MRKYSTSASKIEKLLEKHGFLIYELLTPDDIQKDVIDKAGSDLKAFEHVNYCLLSGKVKVYRGICSDVVEVGYENRTHCFYM